MMKWNSAKTYTENDMLLMQQEAVNRVRDFQTRARSAGAFFEPPESPTPYAESLGDTGGYGAENSEANFFAQSREDFGSYGAENRSAEFSAPAREGDGESLIEAQSRPVDAFAPPAHPSDPIHGLLDRLGVDSETLLILGLMFLLYNEKADNVLLLALAYLLI